MKIDEGKYSIAEIADWFKARTLIANEEYQRGGRLWPNSAKSYFIDTVLRDFPFPKLYFHEKLDKKTNKPRREIVDGQQRVSTIVDFLDGKFALGGNAGEFEGLRFDELSDERKVDFLSYTISVDVIRNADRSEILQMFRRMNAYTLPLNPAEKRNSEFSGAFKDWINQTLDRFGAIFVHWNILSSRQIVRMADAELIADLVLAIEEGIISTSPKKLYDLYKNNDEIFSNKDVIEDRLAGALQVIVQDLSEIQGSYATRPHVFHSLVCALIHNRFGIPGAGNVTGFNTTGRYFADQAQAVASIRRLAAAHEENDVEHFPEYVKAASEGGNRAPQRAVRIEWLCRALQGEFA